MYFVIIINVDSKDLLYSYGSKDAKFRVAYTLHRTKNLMQN